MLLNIAVDKIRDFVSRWVVNDHAEFRPTVDGERRKFELKRAELGVTNTLKPPIMSHHVLVAPQGVELRAYPGEFVNKVRDLLCGSGPRDVCAKRAHDKACDAQSYHWWNKL